MQINKIVMYANFENPRSRDHEVELPQKNSKKWRFIDRKFITLLLTQKPLDVQRRN